ncbi:TetR/AcrR family transcriptional regulator [Embleya sp. NBC_00896]|uniref:TetR/AcrR family transcriptional regulator n=1 Tax=Embleya sp. NBC_00896 TaxID=2975961 RepID=UPI0038638056|nr:TetR/AcrR family transcriptional regulator [Embleya sp. NBC_00896]
MTRPMRADARRNYDRLLAEAQVVFGEHGTDASLEELARRAGVGIGTLYRHFPTRDALIEAVVRDRFDRLAARAEALRDADAARDALATWLRLLIEGAGTFRGMSAALMTTLADETSQLYASCHAMRAAGTDLLTRAQRAGEVRPDIDTDELFTLAHGIAWAHEQRDTDDPHRLARLMEVVMFGLATRPRSDLDPAR